MNYLRNRKAEKIARKIFRKYHGCFPEHFKDKSVFSPDFETVLGSYKKTRVFCSNPSCCGNPRRIKGAKNLTLQELKAPRMEEEWA